MLTIETPPRGSDAHGQGHYGALRGARTHKGVDLAAYPGSILKSPATGTVERLGYPYNPDDPVKGFLRLIVLKLDDGHRLRFFYVLPLVSPGDRVTPGDPLGIVQNIQIAYDHRMTPHIHFEVIDPQGKHIDPSSAADNGDSLPSATP